MGGGAIAKAPLPRTFTPTDEFLRVRPFPLARVHVSSVRTGRIGSTRRNRQGTNTVQRVPVQTTPDWLNHKESFGFYDSDTRFELKQWLERHHQSATISQHTV